MNKKTRHAFRIPIGDWSGDGHSKCDWFGASAAKPIDEVREAFFAAQKNFPKRLDVSQLCTDYGNSSIPDQVRDQLFKLGAPIEEANEDGDYYSGSEEMAALVVWFLNQGDPELDCKLDEDASPMLPFYGADCKGRHISHIGYGLFE